MKKRGCEKQERWRQGGKDMERQWWSDIKMAKEVLTGVTYYLWEQNGFHSCFPWDS